MKKITAFILLLLSLVSCNEKTAQDLFDESKTGVVLILNEYYYVMKLPNGNSIYFTGIDQEGNLENLAFEYADIKNKRQILTGTGFFIDKQGTIMTNRHVAQPSIDKTAVKESYNNMVASIKAYYAAQMSALSQEYQNLESQKSDCYSYDYYGNVYENTDKLQEIASQQSELEEQFNTLNSVRESMDDHVSLDELSITAVCEIGIAYDNTFVNDKVKNMFSSHNDKILHIDQQLYMIGYNAGPTLATTKQGIQVQMTSGKVTQLPDGDRVLYSIPTMQGSSGSPVIDSKGRLVAVNFAKLRGSDNFNFGIPMNKIAAFLK